MTEKQKKQKILHRFEEMFAKFTTGWEHNKQEIAKDKDNETGDDINFSLSGVIFEFFYQFAQLHAKTDDEQIDLIAYYMAINKQLHAQRTKKCNKQN